MKTFTKGLYVSLLALVSLMRVNAQTIQWTVPEQWGAGTTIANKIVQASSTHFMIAGGYGASTNAGCGGMYISKYDIQGNRIWSDSLNYAKHWAGPAIATNGSSYHFLYKYPKFFIRKYNTAGLKMFDKTFTTDAVDGYDLLLAPDGYLYLCGGIPYGAKIGQDSLTSGGFIAKLDTIGNLIWTKHINLINNQNYSGAGQAMRIKYYNGKLFILGALTGNANIDSFTLNGYHSSYYLQLDTAGTVNNAFILPVPCEDMASDQDGGLYFKGEFGGSATFGQTTITQTAGDFFSYCVAKYNGTNWIWAKELPEIGRGAVSVNSNKEVYCLGNAYVNNSDKIYNIVRLDSSANSTWSYTSNPTSNPQDQSANSILANNNELYVIGQSIHAFVSMFSSPSTSIKEMDTDLNSINVYPNPSFDIFNIAYSKEFENFKAYITDAQGKTVMILDNVKSSKSIDLSSLPKGEYMLNIIEDKNKFIKPLLKL